MKDKFTLNLDFFLYFLSLFLQHWVIILMYTIRNSKCLQGIADMLTDKAVYRKMQIYFVLEVTEIRAESSKNSSIVFSRE